MISFKLPAEMDFRRAEFPSDALSVKRLRATFPQHFDGPGTIEDSFANNDFFYPQAAEQPDHLMWLTQLIMYERVVAAGAYYSALEKNSGEILDDEAATCIREAKDRLLEHYQYFKLADGPEMARVLIGQVELEGQNQAQLNSGKSR